MGLVDKREEFQLISVLGLNGIQIPPLAAPHEIIDSGDDHQ